MAPLIHCVRHAQGYHNISTENHNLVDPILTPFGEEQCAALSSSFPAPQDKISLVFASPLRRTLHTALLTFQPALASTHCYPKILAIPEVQETSDWPCDTGSPPAELQRYCQEHDWPADLSLVKDGWNNKSLSGKWAPGADALHRRAREGRRIIRSKIQELIEQGIEDPQVVLVSHGGILHYFTEDWEDTERHNGTAWANTEVRSYTFEHGVSNDEDANAGIVETPESRTRRGKTTPWIGRDNVLFLTAMMIWEKCGLQNPMKMGQGQIERDTGDGQEPAVGVDVKGASAVGVKA